MDAARSEFRARLRETVADLEQLILDKNFAYGNSYEVVPAIMAQLYPDGIGPEQMKNMLFIVRILDKLKRIVENNDPFGEDPFIDLAGYGILALVTRRKTPDDLSSPAPLRAHDLQPGPERSSNL